MKTKNEKPSITINPCRGLLKFLDHAKIKYKIDYDKDKITIMFNEKVTPQSIWILACKYNIYKFDNLK